MHAGNALCACVPGEKLDPRAAVAGRALNLTAPGGELWQSGLFDRGSWTEAQAGWARRSVPRPFAPAQTAALLEHLRSLCCGDLGSHWS